MDRVVGKVVYLKTRCTTRVVTNKQRHQTAEDRLRQAQLLALMSLETDDLHPDMVMAALRIADRYMSTLRGCIQIVGGSNLETIATFSEGKVMVDKLSQ
ncbi:hypothetical protein RYB67_10500 [Pseudomonas syringae]|nr:hypothetical protein [Pseudomonas syringae]